jgi:hypothetical protein
MSSRVWGKLARSGSARFPPHLVFSIRRFPAPKYQECLQDPFLGTQGAASAGRASARYGWRVLRIWYEMPVMTSPRVTVIIATYNWSTVLPYAIDSVLGQTMRDFELLVVGDGCTDDSEQVVTAIKDRRVRGINLPANTGHQSGPNNRGLQEARGEFVAYLGHDDLWLSHHLQCTTEKLDETGAAFAHSLLVRVAPDHDVGMPVLPQPRLRNGGPPSCTVHRRSVTDKIGGWNDYRRLSIPPETDFFYRAQAAGFEAVFVQG